VAHIERLFNQLPMLHSQLWEQTRKFLQSPQGNAAQSGAAWYPFVVLHKRCSCNL